MAPHGTASFEQHFQDLQDPRVERTRKHPLINIVFMTVCGVLSGANSIAGIHEFAIDRRSWLARYIDLSSGIPSEDTFGRVLARLDPAGFEKCLLGWIRDVQLSRSTAYGSGPADCEAGRAAIHMVSAWATENKLSLGQVVVDEKSNEITAIPNLLDLLEIAGALVTIDAMGCQREIAGKIRDRKADYILAVKQNQPTLYERVGAAIAEALEGDTEALDEHETVEKGHGRRETRTYAVARRG
jgi:predicted transposase YbfD/YdcC